MISIDITPPCAPPGRA